MNLLDVYNEMASESSAQYEKTAEAAQIDEQTEVLEKYASLADNLLANEYGNNYDQNDIVELAGYMINHDIEKTAAMEKVAEAYQVGQIMAEGFKSALNG